MATVRLSRIEIEIGINDDSADTAGIVELRCESDGSLVSAFRPKPVGDAGDLDDIWIVRPVDVTDCGDVWRRIEEGGLWGRIAELLQGVLGPDHKVEVHNEDQDARQKPQNSPEGDAGTPEGPRGPDAVPDATAAPESPQKELPRPDAIGLSMARLRHAAGRTDIPIHDLIDVLENLGARVETLETYI